MPSPLRRLRTGLLTLAAIFVAGVLGYRVAGWSLLDSVYMVVITMSTVGYNEVGPMTPGLKCFTIGLIVVGVSAAFYTLGGLVQMMAEGEINRALGRRRVTHQVQRLAGHVIICGFGRMGEVLAGELTARGQPLVIVEKRPEQVSEAAAQGHLAVHDDATEEQALESVGVRRAKALVTTLPSDADNVFITLTARNLNPALKIIARGEFRSTEKKLIQAGADRVVLPAATGALRMAAMITRPSIIDLIELAAGRQTAEVVIDELTIPAGSPLAGCTVRQTQPRSRHGLLVVAIRQPNNSLEFNPETDASFPGGGGVIVLGRADDIERFRKEYGM
jgi:voltage-gated potassium channel